MIKRDGLKIVSANVSHKSKNTSMAQETLSILEKGHYTAPSGAILDISEILDDAVQETKYYPANSVLLVKDSEVFPTIEVVNETTSQAAERLLQLGKTNVVALNFASATNPGGGWLSGAQAQEEDLARASGLYQCLRNKPMFYNDNHLSDNGPYYTHGAIYSPKVPFFRDHYKLLMEQPYTLSIITCPAPCLINVEVEDVDALEVLINERAQRILEIAAHHGHRNIILGAWGAGAFRNDVNMIAQAFKLALEAVPQFEHVCFAVYDTRTPPYLYECFKNTFTI